MAQRYRLIPCMGSKKIHMSLLWWWKSRRRLEIQDPNLPTVPLLLKLLSRAYCPASTLTTLWSMILKQINLPRLSIVFGLCRPWTRQSSSNMPICNSNSMWKPMRLRSTNTFSKCKCSNRFNFNRFSINIGYSSRKWSRKDRRKWGWERSKLKIKK